MSADKISLDAPEFQGPVASSARTRLHRKDGPGILDDASPDKLSMPSSQQQSGIYVNSGKHQRCGGWVLLFALDDYHVPFSLLRCLFSNFATNSFFALWHCDYYRCSPYARSMLIPSRRELMFKLEKIRVKDIGKRLVSTQPQSTARLPYVNLDFVPPQKCVSISAYSHHYASYISSAC